MLKYLRVLFFCLPKIIWAYFTWILKFSKHPEKYSLELRFYKTQKLIRYVLKKFHINYLTYDSDELFKKNKDKARLIVCNHLSDLDPLIFIALSEKPITFAAKIQIKKMPIVGKIVTILNGKFLDRDDLKQQLRIMKEIEVFMQNNPNLDWVIFPEGTRYKNPNQDILEFHHGTFRPAFKAGSDIVVMALFGTFRVLKIHDNSKNYPVEIKYIHRFTNEDYQNATTSKIALEAHDMMSDALKTLRKIDQVQMKNFNA